MQAWGYAPKHTPIYTTVALVAEVAEVITVILGSCFIGMTDFMRIEKLYGHLRQDEREDM